MRPPTRRLDGPPFALPPLLDAASERWWALPPRLRGLLLILAAASVVTLLATEVLRPVDGPAVPVAVATRDLPAGHRLAAGDLAARDWPRDLAPERPAAVDAQGTLLGPVPAGVPVARQQVADGGLAARAQAGTSVVALPASVLPAGSVGTRLDLVAVDHDGRSRVVARGARVLTADEQRAWVEVPDAAATDVAAAAHAEALVAVLHAP